MDQVTTVGSTFGPQYLDCFCSGAYLAWIVERLGGFNCTAESGDGTACWDVTINNFDPALCHMHMEAPGHNGGRTFNYSSLKVGDGRFFGCQELWNGG